MRESDKRLKNVVSRTQGRRIRRERKRDARKRQIEVERNYEGAQGGSETVKLPKRAKVYVGQGALEIATAIQKRMLTDARAKKALIDRLPRLDVPSDARIDDMLRQIHHNIEDLETNLSNVIEIDARDITIIDEEDDR